MIREVKIGIVGFGSIGSAHAHCIANHEVEGMRLAAICDSDPDKAESASNLYHEIPVYKNFKDMFNSGDVDSVLIATPHYLHPVIGMEAFKYGLNVLSEKPLAVSVTEALRFSEAAKKSGKVFAIMFQWRMHPLFQRARSIINGGEIGEIKHLVWIVTNWYRTQRYYDSGKWRATWNGEGGGVLLNQAPHNLDQIQWLCGLPVKVHAQCNVAQYHRISVEDDAVVTGKFQNGASFTFVTSTGDYPGTNRLEISGTKGCIIMEENKLKITRLEVDEECYRFNSEKFDHKPHYSIEEIEGSGDEDSFHRAILQNFTDCILKDFELVSEGSSGINELLISNAAYLSSWTGKTVEIPFDTSEFDELLEKKKAQEKSKEYYRIEEKTEPSTEYDKRWFINW